MSKIQPNSKVPVGIVLNKRGRFTPMNAYTLRVAKLLKKMRENTI
jgi:hypothetical protein